MQLRPSILKVLAYFDLFSYPLTAEDILFFLDKRVESAELTDALEELIEDGHVFRLSAFYSLRDDPALAERRLRGNRNAQRLMTIASKGSCLLFRFPFVRGVGISGSLSKNFADEHADIDYFIITRANRLWIARTLMHFFKKLNFLIGRQDWYCMNYYVDEDALEINERNIFTATELIALVPVCGNGVMEDFFDANGWAMGYLPNYDLKKANMRPTNPRSWLKNLIERLLDNRLGDMLDNYLLSLTTRRWTKKAGNGALTKKGDPMRLQTGKHIARPDPSLLQARILTQYNDKMKGLAAKWPDLFYATR